MLRIDPNLRSGNRIGLVGIEMGIREQIKSVGVSNFKLGSWEQNQKIDPGKLWFLQAL